MKVKVTGMRTKEELKKMPCEASEDDL